MDFDSQIEQKASNLLGRGNQKSTDRPASKYVERLVRANEIRKIEQTAAWDSMMSKESRREGGKQVEDAFITGSYMKQLEIQEKHKKVVD